jgi:hypothetical protein
MGYLVKTNFLPKVVRYNCHPGRDRNGKPTGMPRDAPVCQAFRRIIYKALNEKDGRIGAALGRPRT